MPLYNFTSFHCMELSHLSPVYNSCWFNPTMLGEAYMRHWTAILLVQVMVWRRSGTNPLPLPIMMQSSVVDWTLMSKLQWNFDDNIKYAIIYIFRNIVCKVWVMFSYPQYGKSIFSTFQFISKEFTHCARCGLFCGCTPVNFTRVLHHGLTLIPAWMNNYIHYKVWDEINYSIPNFNGCTADVWEWINNLISHFTWYLITYPCCD